LVIGGRVQFGEQQLEGAAALSDGQGADAFVRPNDVILFREHAPGSAGPAIVDAMSDLGWTSKVRLTLPDGQNLTAQVPNDQLIGITEGARIYVDLRNAKVFPTPGERIVASDELAAV
jgi:ABC-type sulfate/molybdate transport systems ATPase subunit